jgi:hypothetical protein
MIFHQHKNEKQATHRVLLPCSALRGLVQQVKAVEEDGLKPQPLRHSKGNYPHHHPKHGLQRWGWG